jgi:mycoredoxin
VTVYWRPGCPYCARLRQDLRVRGLPSREVNTWADPSAAAVVRGLAGGNETVPTVVIGDRGYVNPTAAMAVYAAFRLAAARMSSRDGPCGGDGRPRAGGALRQHPRIRCS